MTVWMVTVRVGVAGWTAEAAIEPGDPAPTSTVVVWGGSGTVSGGGWERMKPATIHRKAVAPAPATAIREASAG